MSEKDIARRISDLAVELIPHNNHAACVLCCLAASVLAYRERELSALACEFSMGELARLDAERILRN